MILPVTVLALPQIAVIARLLRGSMVEVLHSNYIRTARAKGLPNYVIVFRHALRAAVLPLVSYLGPAVAGLLTGSLIVENIFGIPGIGRYFVDGALNRDYTLVLGVVICYAAFVILFNLLADILYAGLDPRVRYRAMNYAPRRERDRFDGAGLRSEGPQPLDRRAPAAHAATAPPS